MAVVANTLAVDDDVVTAYATFSTVAQFAMLAVFAGEITQHRFALGSHLHGLLSYRAVEPATFSIWCSWAST